MKLNCAECGKEVNRRPFQLKRSKSGRAFCNRTCATKYNNRIYKKAEKHPNWTTGYGSYRIRALKEFGHKCSNTNCPIKFEIPNKMYDVDHIDNNRTNNKLENLQVLCVWCHALKTRGIA